MRQIMIAHNALQTPDRLLHLRYTLTGTNREGCVRYGVTVACESGEEAVEDLTARFDRALMFFRQIVRCGVTPVSLKEVAEDFAAEP
mgnify:CR=1 FL=1